MQCVKEGGRDHMTNPGRFRAITGRCTRQRYAEANNQKDSAIWKSGGASTRVMLAAAVRATL
jgi:hypothetical protein